MFLCSFFHILFSSLSCPLPGALLLDLLLRRLVILLLQLVSAIILLLQLIAGLLGSIWFGSICVWFVRFGSVLARIFSSLFLSFSLVLLFRRGRKRRTFGTRFFILANPSQPPPLIPYLPGHPETVSEEFNGGLLVIKPLPAGSSTIFVVIVIIPFNKRGLLCY